VQLCSTPNLHPNLNPQKPHPKSINLSPFLLPEFPWLKKEPVASKANPRNVWDSVGKHLRVDSATITSPTTATLLPLQPLYSHLLPLQPTITHHSNPPPPTTSTYHKTSLSSFFQTTNPSIQETQPLVFPFLYCSLRRNLDTFFSSTLCCL